jgi:ubiquitin-conjugating enzyme E2 Z
MKDCFKRIILDIKDIQKDEIPNIYFKINEDNIQYGYACIIGPENTPYQYGYYLFEFYFTEQYPYEPPKVKYYTNDGVTRFNPNFYRNGKVCLSILNTWEGEKWSSCQSLRSVLLTLQMTMNETPLLNEPGITESNHGNMVQHYTEAIKFKNLEVGILNFLVNKDRIDERFRDFYDVMKEKYEEHKDAIYEIMNTQDIKVKQARVSIYKMNICIDYNRLIESFNAIQF